MMLTERVQEFRKWLRGEVGRQLACREQQIRGSDPRYDCMSMKAHEYDWKYAEACWIQAKFDALFPPGLEEPAVLGKGKET